MDDLIVERVTVKTVPAGGFLFALHIPETNNIQIGLGWWSRNRLQVSHISTSDIHQYHVQEMADNIARDGVKLNLGKLAEIFTSDPDAVELPVRGEVAGALAEAMRKVHNAAWGDPNAWEPHVVTLLDGRVVWCMYDDNLDRIRLGIGMIDENNDPKLGDNTYLLSSRGVGEYIENLRHGRAQYFFATPSGWPIEFDQWVDSADDLNEVALQLEEMAAAVWPEIPES